MSLFKKQEDRINTYLNAMVVRKPNRVMFLLGQKGAGKSFSLERCLRKYHQEIAVVRINGSIRCTQNRLNEQMYSSIIQKSENIGEEMKESKKSSPEDMLRTTFELLERKKNESKPILIIFDKFDEFPHHRKKQFFFYSLLEEIIKDKFPIGMIGLVKKINFDESLEKRIRSRISLFDTIYFSANFAEKTLLNNLNRSIDSLDRIGYSRKKRNKHSLELSISALLQRFMKLGKPAAFYSKLAIDLAASDEKTFKIPENPFVKIINDLPMPQLSVMLIVKSQSEKASEHGANLCSVLRSYRCKATSHATKDGFRFSEPILKSALRSLIDQRLVRCAKLGNLGLYYAPIFLPTAVSEAVGTVDFNSLPTWIRKS